MSAFKKMVSVLLLCFVPSVASADEITQSVSQSDDFKRHELAFVTATKKLISDGTCKVSDFEYVGGFLKSMNHKNKPIYFTYCGGMTISNRLYLNVSTGEIFR
ncbi:exported hypothetical protein [Agrobacterium fabacearum CFBP 5771]|nr:exported hypothetical protein [Agrobacterium fabacearum CFBP 5771]